MNQQRTQDELGIDFEKLRGVIFKNWIWLALIFLLCNGIAYLTIRWTKPLYESESILRLDVKDDRNLLGLPNMQDETENVLAGEIELIKSKIFLSRVLESMDLAISYYTAGDVLRDERFNSSPIVATIAPGPVKVYDVPVYIEIVDKQHFKASLGDRSDLDQSQTYQYDQLVTLGELSFRLYLTEAYSDEAREFVYFFILNSSGSLMSYMENNLIVEPAKQVAKTIRIAFKDNNPLKAQTLVNAIDTLYLKYTDRKQNLENEQKIQWLDAELVKIESQLNGYENYIEKFTIENRSSDLNEDLKRVLQVMNSLDSQRYELDSRIRQLARLQQKIQSDGSDILALNTVPIPDYLQENLVELEELLERRERMRLSYTESTMAIQRLNEGVSNAEDLVLTQINGLKERLEQELLDVNRSKANLETEFATLPGKSNEFNKNKRFYELYEQFYLSLLQSKAQFEIARAGTSNDFVILSPANLPAIPISPNNLMIHGIGLVAGTILSLFMIGIFYLANNKVNNLKELENYVQASILGSIPRVSGMTHSQLIVDKRPRSAVSEALRSIRTNVQFMIGQSKHSIVSITSTVSGEGKTFLAVNLGGILAMTHKRVVILDLDMRRPRVHDSFMEKNGEKGISTVLIEQYAAYECIRHTSIENLDYIPAGPTPPNPSELLLRNTFDELLLELKKSYDVIILDTPPVGIVTDGKIILQKSDLSVYVVRANYSRKSFLSTIAQLQETKTPGSLAVVLNAASRSRNEKYGYGYYQNTEKESAKSHA